MKRTFGKNILLFILIVLFTLCMAVGCTTLNVSSVQDEQPSTPNTASSITLELNRPAMLPGENIDLTVTVKMKNDGSHANNKWGSADFFIKSDLADKLELVNVNSADEKFNKGNYDLSGDFASENRYTSSLVQNTDAGYQGFLRFHLEAQSESQCISATENLVIKMRFKLKSDASKDADLNFDIAHSSYNLIATWGYNGEDGTGIIFTANDNLTIDASGSSAEVRDPSADNDLDFLNVIEGKLDGTTEGEEPTKFVTPITVKDADDNNKPITSLKFETSRESKDVFYIQASPKQETSTVEVKVSGAICSKVDGYDDIYKVQLNGGNNGITPISIVVTSETNVTQTYTLSVTQKYIGLAKLEVESNETLPVDEKKIGLSDKTPVEEGRKTFDVLVPMSDGVDGSASQVTITPSVIKGYGINTTITISASNCSIVNGATTVGDGDSFIVNNIQNNATITMTLKSATSTSSFTINIKKVSVNTAINSLQLTGVKNSGVITPADKVNGIDYTFKLPKESGYKATLSADDISLDTGATFVLKQDNVEIGKVDEKYTLSKGRYTLTIVSAAGNTQDYSIDVTDEVLPGAIVSFEYSINDGADWIKVFDRTNNYTGADFKYDPDTKKFDLNASTTTKDTGVKFRIAITDNSTLKGFTGSEITDEEHGKYPEYRTFEYAYTNLKNGVNNKIITVESNQGTGSNAYQINVIITEDEYYITDIDFGNDASGTKYFTFNKDTYEYNFSVPYATNEVDLTIFAKGLSTIVYVNNVALYREDAEGTHTGESKHSNTINLKSSTTTKFTITYKGTDGIKTDENDKPYVVNVTRNKASDVNTLSSLTASITYNDDSTVDNVITDFTSDVTTYNYKLLPGKTLKDINITAVASANVATVNGSVGKIDLTNVVEEVYTFRITVTPENSMYGSGVKTYTINLRTQEVELDQDARIRDLQIIGTDGKNYLANFDSSNPSYVLSVPYSISAFKVFAVYGEKATIVENYTVDGVVDTDVNSDGFRQLAINKSNIYTIQAIAEDTDFEGTKYTIKINRAPANTNATLSTLRVNNAAGANLLGSLTSGKFDYKVTANNHSDSNKLIIKAESAISTAVITLSENGTALLTKNGTLTYEIGNIAYGTSKIYTIAVKVDDTTNIYTVEIKRDQIAPTLENLEIYKDGSDKLSLLDKDGNKLNGFDKKIFEYTVKVPYSTQSVTINGTVPSGMTPSSINLTKLIATEFGNEHGMRTYKFSVVNGDLVQEYVINIIREANPDINTNVTSITFAKIPDFVFDNGKDYLGAYVVKYNINTLNPVIVLENAADGAKYVIKLNGNLVTAPINLPVGKNTIEIIVTASDNITTRTITIEVERKHADIKGIDVNNSDGGAKIETGIQLESDKDSYSFNVENGISSLDVKLNLEEGYTYTVSNNVLTEGKMNKVTVQIKDSTGAVVRTLDLNVYRDAAPADYTMWYIIAGVLGGLAIILLIIAIIAFVKGGKGGSKRKGSINDIGIGDYELD